MSSPPKGTIRHHIGGDCPYVVVSRTEKGQVTSLPLKDIGVSCAAPETAVTTSTYLPEENHAYYKSISVVPGETLKATFERASKIPLELLDQDSPEVEASFIERLWRLGLTLVLIMASEENLVDTGRRLKIVKPKNRSSPSMEYWSPNYLGRVYRSQSQDAEAESHLRPHWRKVTSNRSHMVQSNLCEKLFGFSPTVLGNQANLMEAGRVERPSYSRKSSSSAVLVCAGSA